MTPRMSVRAAARDIYAESTEQEARDPARAGAPDLMAAVRALYEDSAVPVREIAARTGVTERTIYKYASKGQWRPRYLWSDASACMLERGWRAGQGFAPAQGAGGRFVRREDAGKPFAKGLKALDPAARELARKVCAEAAERAHRARQQAELDRLRRERLNTLVQMNRCMDEMLRYRDQHARGRRDREQEGLLLEAWQYSLDSARAAQGAVEQFEAGMKAGSPAQNAPRCRE